MLKQEQEQETAADQVKEDELVRRSQKDPAAFQPLYEKYFRQVLLFILRRVYDKALARDLTQQVFFKALLNIGRFQIRGFPFSSWLYRIAINECNEYFRKANRVRWVAIDDSHVDGLYEELTADNSRDDWEKKLPAILGKLKPAELLLVELRFFEGKSFLEIGEIIDTSEQNAKARTYRTLHKMKKLFLS